MVNIHPDGPVPVSGFIPRVENTSESKAFLSIVRPPYAMVNLDVARQLVNDGSTATEFTPEATAIITTSTINDSSLYNITLAEEAELVSAFNPAYHIPADQSLYDEHTPRDREQQLIRLLKGTAEIQSRFAATGSTDLIPLIKGVSQAELARCFEALTNLGTQTVAFYATQYFTGGQPNIDECKEMFAKVDAVLPDSCSLLVIGAAGETLRDSYPKATTAVASWYAWYSRIKAYYPAEIDPETIMNRPGEVLSSEAIEEMYLPFVDALHNTLGVSTPPSYRLEWHHTTS